MNETRRPMTAGGILLGALLIAAPLALRKCCG